MGMNGLMEKYLAALGSCLNEETFKSDDLLQDHLPSISQDLTKLEETINRLKLHQVNILTYHFPYACRSLRISWITL